MYVCILPARVANHSADLVTSPAQSHNKANYKRDSEMRNIIMLIISQALL